MLRQNLLALAFTNDDMVSYVCKTSAANVVFVVQAQTGPAASSTRQNSSK